MTATGRSTPAAFLGFFDDIRKRMAKENGVDAALFSFNSKGACPVCKGRGVIVTELVFMDPVTTVCEACEGCRYSEQALSCRYKGRNIVDILRMSAEEAAFLPASAAKTFSADFILDAPDGCRAIAACLEGDVDISVDLDVLDPAFLPATGTPEPGGIRWNDVLRLIREPTAELIAASEEDEPAFRAASRELRQTLSLLLEGPMKGVFDGPTTRPLDLDAPAVSVDISRVAAAGDQLVAAAILSTQVAKTAADAACTVGAPGPACAAARIGHPIV